MLMTKVQLFIAALFISTHVLFTFATSTDQRDFTNATFLFNGHFVAFNSSLDSFQMIGEFAFHLPVDELFSSLHHFTSTRSTFFFVCHFVSHECACHCYLQCIRITGKYLSVLATVRANSIFPSFLSLLVFLLLTRSLCLSSSSCAA